MTVDPVRAGDAQAVPPLLGREREMALIGGLIDRVGDGGGALVVRGDAGIGKSALLSAAHRRGHDAGVTVLTASGVPSETHMAFAGLSQLLRPLRDQMATLPAPQRDALSSAFGMSDGTAPDVFLIALAGLSLLADKAASSALLLIVEDAHWLDAATCDVLAFIARRVAEDPIVLLVSTRDDVRSRLVEARLPELQLTELDDISAGALLDLHATDLAPPVRERLLAAAAGNPLALVELPRSLRATTSDVTIDLAPLPITKRLEHAFSGRAAELPPTTRTLLLVAALDEGGSLRATLDAAAVIEGGPVTLDDLAPAEAARLVVVGRDGLRFRHALVSAAIAQGASTSARQTAYTALAAAYATDPDRSVWHRAAALSGEEDQVAADLEAAADRALRRGAPQVAAAALERAGQLDTDPARRGRLLLRAAEMEFELGRPDRSSSLLAEARHQELEPHDRAQMSSLVDLIEDRCWSDTTELEALVDIARQMMRAGEPGHALDTLLTAAFRCWWGNPDDRARAAVVAAAEQVPCPGDDPALLAVLAYADPVRRGALVMNRITALTPDPADARGMYLIGCAASTVWAYDLALRFLDVAVDGLRAQRRLGLLARARVTQAWAAVHQAREPLAVSAAEEGGRLAEETGQRRWGVIARLATATIAAERGDVALAEALVTEAEAELVPEGAGSVLALAQFVRGRGAVAYQRYEEGYEHLRRTLQPTDPAYHPFIGAWGLSDLVEAAAHGGQVERAMAHLVDLESLAASTGGPLLQAEVGYARPMVADDEAAEGLFQEALENALANWPCFRGRMLLWYGRWLRRRRRIAESRVPLRAARDAFDALAFPALAERARQELRASGESSSVRPREAWDQLTPQELQIGLLAAAGLSNREIGEQLYVSHRTVGSHLHRMFPKLGVTSRSQLRDALEGVAPT